MALLGSGGILLQLNDGKPPVSVARWVSDGHPGAFRGTYPGLIGSLLKIEMEAAGQGELSVLCDQGELVSCRSQGYSIYTTNQGHPKEFYLHRSRRRQNIAVATVETGQWTFLGEGVEDEEPLGPTLRLVASASIGMPEEQQATQGLVSEPSPLAG